VYHTRPLRKWLLLKDSFGFGGWSLKIDSNIEKLGITLAIVDRWPLFRGGG
jgi:hypothetical protein